MEDHEVGQQDLVHPPQRLEAVQVVLGRLGLDVAGLAGQVARWPGGSARRGGSSTAVTGCWASQSISRSGCSSRSSSAIATSRWAWPSPIGEETYSARLRRELRPAATAARRRRPGRRSPAGSRLTRTGSRSCGAVAGPLERHQDRAQGSAVATAGAARAGQCRPGAVDHQRRAPDLGAAAPSVSPRRQPLGVDAAQDRLRVGLQAPADARPRSAWSSAAR